MIIDTAITKVTSLQWVRLDRLAQCKLQVYITLVRRSTQGTHVNALQQMPSYTPCWLFFNADDEAQLNWAAHQKTQCTSPKFILTGGAINTAEKKLNAVIYFDQAGKITTKLHIAHVPAKVTRHQNHLVIAELAIKENGDVL